MQENSATYCNIYTNDGIALSNTVLGGLAVEDNLLEALSQADYEDGYSYEARIIGPQRDVISAVKKIKGVRDAEPTGAKDGDGFVLEIETIPGIDIRRPLFAMLSERGWPLIGLTPIGTDLESVFIKLVDRSDGIGTAEARFKKAR